MSEKLEEIKDKIKRSMHEVRTVTCKVQLRTEGEGDNVQEVIEGYALKFNQWSTDLGFWVPLIEKISPNALDKADMSDVKCLFNHDANMPLGRNTISAGQPGNLQLNVDNLGLHYRCIPTNTTFASDLKENIRAGVVNQCSFAFALPDDDDSAYDVQYNEATGNYEATINRFQAILDVSPVTFPAYSDTEVTVGQRCANKVNSIVNKRKIEERDTSNCDECTCSNCTRCCSTCPNSMCNSGETRQCDKKEEQKREHNQKNPDKSSLFLNLAKINYVERMRRNE